MPTATMWNRTPDGRRPPQFSLRGLFLITLLVAAGVWIAQRREWGFEAQMVLRSLLPWIGLYAVYRWLRLGAIIRLHCFGLWLGSGAAPLLPGPRDEKLMLGCVLGVVLGVVSVPWFWLRRRSALRVSATDGANADQLRVAITVVPNSVRRADRQSRRFWMVFGLVLSLAAMASWIQWLQTYRSLGTDGEAEIGWPCSFCWYGGDSCRWGFWAPHLLTDILVWVTLAAATACEVHGGFPGRTPWPQRR